MTVEEKKAMQTVIINELMEHQHDDPTMLVDALIADRGYEFLYGVLQRRAQMTSQLAQMTLQLFRSFTATRAPAPEPAETEVA